MLNRYRLELLWISNLPVRILDVSTLLLPLLPLDDFLRPTPTLFYPPTRNFWID